jgi:hypothetical protein
MQFHHPSNLLDSPWDVPKIMLHQQRRFCRTRRTPFATVSTEIRVEERNSITVRTALIRNKFGVVERWCKAITAGELLHNFIFLFYYAPGE